MSNFVKKFFAASEENNGKKSIWIPVLVIVGVVCVCVGVACFVYHMVKKKQEAVIEEKVSVDDETDFFETES